MQSGFGRAVRLFMGIGLVAALLAVPVSAQVAEREVTIKHNGLNLNARLVGSAIGSDMVLLVHGTLAHNDMEIIRAQRKLLADRGFSVLAINLGLGLSDRQGMYDCAQPHRHTEEGALDEIAAWLDWIEGQGPRSVALIGHSRGGAEVARFLGERGAGNVARAVLIAPTVFDPKAAADEYQTRFKQPLQPVLTKAEELVAAGKGAEIMPETDFLYCAKANVTAAAFASYYKGKINDGPSWLPKSPVPVLVMVAGDDTVVKGLATIVKPLANGKRVTMATIDGADHFFQDLFGEELAERMESFLKGN